MSMGSPNKPNDEPYDDNLYYNLNNIHPYVGPPPSPAMNAWRPPAEPTNTAQNGDNGGTEFDTDVDDLMNFENDNDENVEGGGKGKELATGNASPNVSPSGMKELGFLWVPQGALDCGGCTLVSEIHDFSNGLYNLRLVVHAVGAYIDHMVFDVETTDVEISTGVETFYINFQGQSIQLINISLAKYGIQINEEYGSILLLDSFIAIYNNILGGLVEIHIQDGSSSSIGSQYSDSTEEGHTDIEEGSVEPNPNTEGGGLNMNQKQPMYPEPTAFNKELPWVEGPGESSGTAAAAAVSGGRPPASSDDWPEVSLQRRRTQRMTLLDLAPYFHIKADRASEILKMCPTTLKLMCRKLDLERWPYRKVRSIDNKISGVKRSIREKAESSDVRAVVNLQERLRKLKEKRRNLYLLLTRR